MKFSTEISINLDAVKDGLRLYIDARTQNTLIDAEDTADENNEARFQLVEGCFYDYTFTDANFSLQNVGDQIVQFQVAHDEGRFCVYRKQKRLIGIIARRLLAGEVEDVFRTGDDHRVDAALGKGLAGGGLPPVEFRLRKNRFVPRRDNRIVRRHDSRSPALDVGLSARLPAEVPPIRPFRQCG